MATWFRKSLGDAVMAAPELETLKEKFTATYQQQPDLNDAAIFVHYDSRGDLHCEVTVYFSPKAASLALSVCAEACEQPPAAVLSLLCGDKHVLTTD
ncbi:MAG: hypothetical protein ABUL58_02410 [Steroidobacter sp.]